MDVYAKGSAHFAVSASPPDENGWTAVKAAWAGVDSACDSFAQYLERRSPERVAGRRLSLPMQARLDRELRAGVIVLDGEKYALGNGTFYYLCEWSSAFDRGVWCEVSREDWIAHTARMILGVECASHRSPRATRIWDRAY